MAYHTYTTSAFVAKSFERGSADRVVVLFTETLGLVYARAIGVREEKSKMRYALQNFSFARVSLVRGKSEWRLVGAEPQTNSFFLAEDRDTRARVLRTVRLLLRLVRGEESHPELFRVFEDGLLHISTSDDPILEEMLALRMLFVLGYIAPEERLKPILEAETLRESGVIENPPLALIHSRIENALTLSHL
jgi:DNA repair protein RecO